MKRIRPYLRFLFRQNLVYIFLFGGLVIVSVVVIPLFVSQIKKSFSDIEKAKIETSTLLIKQRVLQSVVNENKNDIDQDLALVTALIPDKEDFFSMIYSLEKLSQSTGFIINNYTVNLTKSSSDKLSISVTGEGGSDTFLNLLRTYKFAGGRLITVEKIGINPVQQNGISLDINFYNKIATLETTEKLDYQGSLNQLNEIRAKTKFAIVQDTSTQQQSTGSDKTSTQEPSALEDYPTKTSLF